MKPLDLFLILLYCVAPSCKVVKGREIVKDPHGVPSVNLYWHYNRLRREVKSKTTAKLNKSYQACKGPGDKSGHCKHFRFCPFEKGWLGNPNFMDYLCVIETSSVGVCCPDDFQVNPPSAGANIIANLPADGHENLIVENLDKSADKEKSLHIKSCGMKTGAQHRHDGGRQTYKKEWPWMAVLLKLDNTSFCGGVLITDQHVLTAAHCTNRLQAEDIKVRLGEYDLSKRDETRAMDFTVIQLLIHEDFDTATYEHDLAILKLQRRTAFNSYIWPICLPPPGLDFVNETATVTGWGRQFFGGPTSKILMEVSMPVWDNERCAKTFTQPISENVFCAAAYEGGKDSCQGDSGGPLQLQLENGRWVNIGIVSWGIRCGMPGRPGVYTRVNKYLPWIVENAV